MGKFIVAVIICIADASIPWNFSANMKVLINLLAVGFLELTTFVSGGFSNWKNALKKFLRVLCSYTKNQQWQLEGVLVLLHN